jgi:hypothetical protein
MKDDLRGNVPYGKEGERRGRRCVSGRKWRREGEKIYDDEEEEESGDRRRSITSKRMKLGRREKNRDRDRGKRMKSRKMDKMRSKIQEKEGTRYERGRVEEEGVESIHSIDHSFIYSFPPS